MHRVTQTEQFEIPWKEKFDPGLKDSPIGNRVKDPMIRSDTRGQNRGSFKHYVMTFFLGGVGGCRPGEISPCIDGGSSN